MAHQQTATARPFGRTTRQHLRPPQAELPAEANIITSPTKTSLQGDIDKLSKGLGSVALRDDDSPQPKPVRSRRTTKGESTTVVASANKAEAGADESATVQQPHQEPPVVRRSRRGAKAISRHPKIGQYRIEITSSERLWCGKFALGISSEQQLGTRLTVQDFDEIFAGEECKAFNEKHGWAGVEDTARNFYDEQLAFVLRVWGQSRGMRLQLGVVRDFEGVFVNGACDDEEPTERKAGCDCTTVWIHNDNAMMLGRPYNHYSGISVLEKAY